MLITLKNQRGVTLVELMIAMLLGLTVISTIITLFVNSVATNRSALQTTRLHQEMRSIMELISSDLRRAGYFRDAHCTLAARNLSATAAVSAGCTHQINPFSPIEIGRNLQANDCVLFSYDYENGANPATPDGIVQTSENYGYKRHISDDGIGFIARRFSGAGCAAGGWRRLSNPLMSNITQLSFDATSSRTVATANGVLSIRVITITLSGQLANDPTVSSTLQNTTHIANHRYCPGVACEVGI